MDLGLLLYAGPHHVRLGAIRSISLLPSEAARQYGSALVDKLDDEDSRVRAAALDTLGLLGDAAHIEAVSAKLVDPHSLLRQSSSRALARLGAGQAAPEVARLLEDEDPDVKREATLALGTLGAVAAGAVTAQRLRHTDVNVRVAAKKALLAMQGNAVADVEVSEVLKTHLHPLLRDEVAEVRRIAAELIERVVGTHDAPDMLAACGKALLEDSDHEVRLAAVRRLGGLGAGAVPSVGSLADRLADESEPVRIAAVEAFAALGEAHAAGAAARVADLLYSSLPSVRRAAAATLEYLGEAGRPYMTSRHVALLDDVSPTVRCGAAEALSETAAAGLLHSEQIAALTALHIDKHWCVRLAAAHALSHCNPTVLVPHIEAVRALLADSDWRVRRELQTVRGPLEVAAKLAEAGATEPCIGGAEAVKVRFLDHAVQCDLYNNSDEDSKKREEAAASRIQAAHRRRVKTHRHASHHSHHTKHSGHQHGHSDAGKHRSRDAPDDCSTRHSGDQRLHKRHPHSSHRHHHSRHSIENDAARHRQAFSAADESEAAAVRIQSIMRGRSARSTIAAQRDEFNKQRQVAAAKIQSAHRRRKSNQDAEASEVVISRHATSDSHRSRKANSDNTKPSSPAQRSAKEHGHRDSQIRSRRRSSSQAASGSLDQ